MLEFDSFCFIYFLNSFPPQFSVNLETLLMKSTRRYLYFWSATWFNLVSLGQLRDSHNLLPGLCCGWHFWLFWLLQCKHCAVHRKYYRYYDYQRLLMLLCFVLISLPNHFVLIVIRESSIFHLSGH